MTGAKELALVPSITADQMALITKTVAVGATPDELKLYIYDCQRHGVHPLDRLIHFTKRGGKYTPVTSIDFMRTRAGDSGEMAGSDDPVFGNDGMVPGGPPQWATVTVYRMTQGQRFAYTATARWSEYKPAEDFMWKKMPHTMLGKCAEALALRKGFPKQLAGLYAREEMEQADTAPTLVIEAPRADAVNEQTGEVEHARPAVPDGVQWIVRCEDLHGKAKKRGNVYFTNGVQATVWMGDAHLFDLCLDLCQRVKPVYPKLQPSTKPGYPPTLKGVTVYEFPSQESHEGNNAPDPPLAIDASQIPF